MKNDSILRVTQLLFRLATYTSLLIALIGMFDLFFGPMPLGPEKMQSMGYSAETAKLYQELDVVSRTPGGKIATSCSMLIQLLFFVFFLKLSKVIQQYRRGNLRSLSNVKGLQSMGGLLVFLYALQIGESLIQFLLYFKTPHLYLAVQPTLMPAIASTKLAAASQIARFVVPDIEGAALICIAAALFLGASILKERIRLEGEVELLKQEVELTV